MFERYVEVRPGHFNAERFHENKSCYMALVMWYLMNIHIYIYYIICIVDRSSIFSMNVPNLSTNEGLI